MSKHDDGVRLRHMLDAALKNRLIHGYFEKHAKRSPFELDS